MKFQLNKGDEILKDQEVLKLISLRAYLDNFFEQHSCIVHGITEVFIHLDTTEEWICEIMTCCQQMIINSRLLLIFPDVHFQFAAPPDELTPPDDWN